MISVSTKFKNAAASDVNKPSYRVRLVLGNYASASAYGTTVASSGDVSTDYPAAGAIDGDRTEINVGSASGADNDIGKSSWRSSGVPDDGDTVTLTLTFTQSRTINRIKLYHLDDAGLKTYSLSYWDGSAWQVFAATSDIVSGDQVSIPTTFELDTIDFPDISTTQIKLIVTHTQVATDKANVVELEVYRLVDISDRMKGFDIRRGRDYKLGNPMASQASLLCINTDRFFSINHTPSSSEVTSGFVNSELRPGIGVIVEGGFETFVGSDAERVTTFVGNADSITINSRTRDATIVFRDGMKALINKTDSTKLKTSEDIGSAINYLLNRANVSNYEMSVDSTSIVLDYFFSDNQNVLTTIQELVQAAGDCLFYFDESGTAQFKFFASPVSQSHTFTSQADWLSGTLTAIDALTVADQITYLFSTAQTWNDATTGWTYIQNPTFGVGTMTEDGVGLRFDGHGMAYRNNVLDIGEWIVTLDDEDETNALFYTQIGLMAQSIDGTQTVQESSSPFKNGYSITLQHDTRGGGVTYLSLDRVDGAVTTHVQRAVIAQDALTHTIRVRRSEVGVFQVWYDGVLIITATDNTYTTSVYFGYGTSNIRAGKSAHFHTSGLSIPTTIDGVGTWISPAIDASTTVVSYGVLTATHVINSGTIAYATRSSADGITWDSWVSVALGSTIGSTVRRYLEVRAVMTFLGTDSPIIFDITVNWNTSTGSIKYPLAPSSFTFSFDSIVLDVQQGLSDSLGGDTSITNDVVVQAQPLVLSGTDADDVWQGTSGVPPVAISGSAPLNVTNGQTLTYSPVISGGMDTSRMSGADPAAAIVTFGGGASGSWSFSSIHPTLPVLSIVITGDGTITALKIQGKRFANSNYFQALNVKDSASINSYGDRQLSISNKWIVSPTHAADVATKLVANYKSPVAYIPGVRIRPLYNAQIGDRVTVIDDNLDLSADYIIANLSHQVSMQNKTANADTTATLLKVPEGS